jgi:hypothetical protein
MVYALLIPVELAALAFFSYGINFLVGKVARRPTFYYLLVMPGTIFHELSHLLACLVMGVRVGEVHLFRLRRLPDGSMSLGSVEHFGAGPVRSFLIGIAPIPLISAFLFLVWHLLVPTCSGASVVVRSPGFYGYVVLAFVIGMAMCPSRQDVRGFVEFILAAGVLGGIVALIISMVSKESDLSGAWHTVNNILKNMASALGVVAVTLAAVLVVVLVVSAVNFRMRRAG